MPGRPSDSHIHVNHPSVIDQRSCRAYPLGQPTGARAGRTFCDPRTSYGRTIGRTNVLLYRARVCRILEEHRSTLWRFHLSGAPIFSMAYPKLFLARIPIGHTVVTRKPLSWFLYAAETANIRCRSGSAATADRKASASSIMPSHGRGKKKS